MGVIGFTLHGFVEILENSKIVYQGWVPKDYYMIIVLEVVKKGQKSIVISKILGEEHGY